MVNRRRLRLLLARWILLAGRRLWIRRGLSWCALRGARRTRAGLDHTRGRSGVIYEFPLKVSVAALIHADGGPLDVAGDADNTSSKDLAGTKSWRLLILVLGSVSAGGWRLPWCGWRLPRIRVGRANLPWIGAGIGDAAERVQICTGCDCTQAAQRKCFVHDTSLELAIGQYEDEPPGAVIRGVHGIFVGLADKSRLAGMVICEVCERLGVVAVFLLVETDRTYVLISTPGQFGFLLANAGSRPHDRSR